MLRSMLLLSDGECLFEEELRFLVTSTFRQIPAGLLQQLSCLSSMNALVLNELAAGQRVGQESLPLGPGSMFHCRSSCINGGDCSFSPLLLCFLIHLILEHCLHQSMHRERVCLRITGEQGIGTQCLNGLMEQVGVSSYRGQVGTKMLCSLCDNLFRNGIRGQKCAQSEEVGGSRAFLLDLREGEGPGGGYWQGVIIHQLSTTLDE